MNVQKLVKEEETGSKIPLILTVAGVVLWFIPFVGFIISYALWFFAWYNYRHSEIKKEKVFAAISAVLIDINTAMVGCCMLFSAAVIVMLAIGAFILGVAIVYLTLGSVACVVVVLVIWAFANQVKNGK